MRSGACQRATRPGASQGSARPARATIVPWCIPRASGCPCRPRALRNAARQAGSGPGAPPSCVRRTGRPTDGGTVRTMEGKDHERQRQGKRGDHRQVRGVRRRDARAGHAPMRGMPRHAVRELRRNMPRLRRRPVPRMLRGMPMRGNPLPRLRAPLQRVRENAAVLRLRSPLRRLRRPALLRLRIQVRGLRLRALLRMRVRPRRRLRLLLRLLEQQTAGTLLRRQPVLAQNAGTQAHAHHRARNRNQRRARPEPTQGKPAHRGLVHRFEPRRRGTRIPDANPHPRGLRRHLRTRARNPHRIKGTRQGWRAHAPAPHEPPRPPAAGTGRSRDCPTSRHATSTCATPPTTDGAS